MKVFEDQMKGLEVGQEAESFSMGGSQSLSDLRGLVTLLVFWKTF